MRQDPTRAEAALWEHLRDHSLGGRHFQRQYVTAGFIVDFYCHTARLVVEVDGEIHAGQTGRDAERDSLLAQRGLRIMRFPNERILNDIYAVLQEIQSAAEDPPPHPCGADAASVRTLPK